MAKRRSVIVKHVTNDEIEHHVQILGVKNRKKTRASCGIAADFFNDVPGIKKKGALKGKDDKKEDHELEDDFVRDVEALVPAVLVDKETVNAGSDIFSFKTPKRAKQMSKLAEQSSRKIRNSTKENETPGKSSKTPSKSVKTKSSTPAKTPSSKTKKSEEVSTPTRMSKRSKKYLVQEVQAQQHEDSGSEEGSDEDDDEENAVEREPVASNSKRIDLPTETELYFEAHKTSKKLGATTSDRTLSKLKTPQISQDRMQEILDKIEKTKIDAVKKVKRQILSDEAKVEVSRQMLVADHRRNFNKWMFYISNGYNLLLYGLGSKRNLVHDFCSKMLSDYDKIIINGYFPSLIIRSILGLIWEVTDDVTIANSNQQQAQLEQICKAYTDSNRDDLFLIVHNIDGGTLRGGKVQNVLSQLAECPKIHIIATIDHINASLIWDQAKLSKFKWLWYDATTFEYYKDETSFENSLLMLTCGTGAGGSLALSGLVHVARSLTPNARGIFKLIAEYQIEETKSNSVNFLGLSFSDLYHMCREKFLVNSELTLRTQLTEFLDHKLVQIRKGVDGSECLSIPLDSSTLQEYLDQSQ